MLYNNNVLYNIYIHIFLKPLENGNADIFEMEDKQVIGPLFLIHVLKR